MERWDEDTTPSNTFKEELETEGPKDQLQCPAQRSKQPQMVSCSEVTMKSFTKEDEHFQNESLTLMSPKFGVHGQILYAVPHTPQMCPEGKGGPSHPS